MEKKITCALFDIDGTILNSEEVYARVNQEVINTFGNGKEYSWEVRRRVMGNKATMSSQIIKESFDINISTEEIIAWKKVRMHELRNTIELIPGTREIFRFLKSQGIKIAAATSSQRKVFESKMEQYQDVVEMFDVIVCGDDGEVKRSKPFPDIFIRAAELCGETDMSKCVVFEDAIFGVMAGLASGAITIAIPDEHFKDDEVFSKAHHCLETLSQFTPQMIGLQGSIEYQSK